MELTRSAVVTAMVAGAALNAAVPAGLNGLVNVNVGNVHSARPHPLALAAQVAAAIRDAKRRPSGSSPKGCQCKASLVRSGCAALCETMLRSSPSSHFDYVSAGAACGAPIYDEG